MGIWGDLFGSGPGKADFMPFGHDIDPGAFQYGQQGQDVYNVLEAGMMGRGGSVAEEQMKRGLERAGKGARAMSIGRGGMGAGTAQRLAAQQAGEAGREMQMAIPTLRAQQQMAAEQQMQNYLGQQMQAQMAEQQMRARQQEYMQQMMLQQDLYNMQNKRSGLEFMGPLLQTGAQMGGFALGM
jgi:hypothetical protein